MAAREVACERRVMRMVVVVSLLAALGCSTSKPATAPMPKSEPAPVVEAEPAPPLEPAPPPGSLTDEQFEAMMAKAIVMFNAMSSAVDVAGGDCGKLADGLNQVLDDYASFIAEAQRRQEDEGVKKRGEEWMQAHMDEVMGPMMKVGTAGQRCFADPAFQSFQQRFDAMN